MANTSRTGKQDKILEKKPASLHMSDNAESCSITSDGLIITIEVSAGSKHATFPDGYNSWRKAYGIAVKAAPVEGKANKAIIGLIADRLNIPKGNVTILSGLTSSVKKVQITGITRQEFFDIIQQG